MKKVIIGIVLGICVGITGFTVYLFFQMSGTVAQDHSAVTQIVSYLNQQIQAKTPTVTPTTK
jgi:TM2 domain-containing membrane protein YozV